MLKLINPLGIFYSTYSITIQLFKQNKNAVENQATNKILQSFACSLKIINIP